jgi:methyl-accepting chemotaxis protein
MLQLDDTSVISRMTLFTALDELVAAASLEAELRDSLVRQERELQSARDEAVLIRESAETSRRDGLLSAARTLGVAIGGIHGASENLRALSQSAGSGAMDQQRLVAEAVAAMDGLDSALGQMQSGADQAVVQAQSARDRALSGAKVVDETVEAIRQVERKAEDLAEVVRSLGSQARDVERIMEVISDIADQTNLWDAQSIPNTAEPRCPSQGQSRRCTSLSASGCAAPCWRWPLPLRCSRPLRWPFRT